MGSSPTTRRKPRFRERNAVRPAAPRTTPPAAPPPPPAATPAVAPPRRRIIARTRLTTEQGLYVAVLALAFALRIWDVGSRAMHGDESVHAWFAWRLFTGAGYQYDPVYHGPLQFPVTALFFFLFGSSEVTGRLFAVLLGTALVGLPYFLRPYMGRTAALIASILIAISPEFVYDSRLERDDALTIFFAMSLAIAILGYVRTGRVRYLYVGAASIALSLTAMENTYITLFVFGTFVLLMLAGEAFAPNRVVQGLIRLSGRVSEHATIRPLSWDVLAGVGALLLIAFALTVLTGLYPPVPLVLALALIFLVMRQAAVTVDDTEERPFLTALRAISWARWLNAITIMIAILFIFYSTFGTNLRGLWDWTTPFFNTGGICPGNPFPLNPCRKDIIGGLFYWLSQHRVARGGQPWFYYSLLMGLYEQLAMIFGVAGIIYFLRRPTLFTTFLTYWAILMFGVYSWAGEKFPWLLVHPLLPFTLLAAMFIAQLFRLRSPIAYAALVATGLLALLELHSVYEVNFVNGADPVEMMVYVQSAPDTPKVAQQIETLSNKVTNGPDLHVTVDSEETWPFAWYLRNMTNVAYPGSTQIVDKPYSTNPVILVDESDQAALLPKLGNRYIGHEYILRWWFPEDYKTLTWSTFGRDMADPGYWGVTWDWLIDRRPFGPKGTVNFYMYIKKGLVGPL